MKKAHIIGLVVIAVAIGIIVSAIWDSASYASFAEAKKAPGNEFHVVGELVKEKEVVYDPMVNPNLVTFHMKDEKGDELKVFLNKAKPQDFEKSEKVVIVGTVKDDAFHAIDILMKCPSKYNEENKVEAPQTASLEL